MGVFDKLFTKKDGRANAESAPEAQQKETVLAMSPKPLREGVERGEAYITDAYSRVPILYDNLPETPVRGMMAFDEANYSEAIRLLSIFLDQYEPIVPVLNTRATAYIQTGELDKAEQDLNAALAIDPEHLLSLQVLSQLYESRKDYGKAIETITRAIDQGHKEPSFNATLYAIRIEFYNKTGDSEKSDADLKKYMELKQLSG